MSQQAGVRTVVVGGRPQPGPMQATSGSRGALAYSGPYLDEDIAISSQFAPNAALPALEPEIELRDSGMYLIVEAFNLRDQVRSPDPNAAPLQFSYEAADCRLYWTLDNALNMTRLWYDAAGAIWGLGLNASCVPGSTGYASHGANATAAASAPENTATRVPYLPALEPKENISPGDYEHVGLEAGLVTGIRRRRPAGQKPPLPPPPCDINSETCLPVQYQCENGLYFQSSHPNWPCVSDRICGPNYLCDIPDDHPVESSHWGWLGPGEMAPKPIARGKCIWKWLFPC